MCADLQGAEETEQHRSGDERYAVSGQQQFSAKLSLLVKRCVMIQAGPFPKSGGPPLAERVER